jgi:exodeoxyribonuclease VII small subunit
MTEQSTEPADGDDTDGDDDPAGEDLAYVDAVDELEAILAELEGDEVDIDVLGAKVRRAAALIRLCRDRVATARLEVEEVVAELDEDDDRT